MTDYLPINTQTDDVVRKDYIPPAIVHELKLETRAGTPTGIDPLVDPLGLDPSKPSPK
jgi:hypothetical protein